ncbi:MAG: phosphatidate cytidylyltransferase [Actinomycetota bacterium]|nr:phosphatidate cytidylyltransferase [Actinomycetota bacterium]MDA3003866.1 phosphatidate cytidylyltransferase [Actinomycetota bacterium]
MSDETNNENPDDTTNATDRTGNDATVDFGDEFGIVKFADDDDSAPAISFPENQTDQLPHWTESPTGELPKFVTASEDTISPTPSAGASRPTVNLTGSTRRVEPASAPPPVARPASAGRVSIGSDPTGERGRPDSSGPLPRRDVTDNSRSEENVSSQTARPTQVRRARPSDRSDSGTGPRPRPRTLTARSSSGARMPSSAPRDLPTATAVGALLAAVFIAAVLVGPVAVMVLLVIVLGLAAVEFFTQASATGYQPALIIGVVGCVSAPLAAYWIGDAALPLVFVFAFVAGSISFIGANSVESGPVPNLGLTLLGLVWIGLFGSYGALILRLSNSGPGFENIGTDTLFILVIGIIANDTAAYFVGAATGRTPLRSWISPTKTMEGFVGGAIGTFVAVIAVGLQSGTWTKLSEWLVIAIVISVVGPIGDLTESMFKRNMDIKDFGTVLRGHGGALDRFDSMLFALPFIYYITLVLTPWTS